MTNCPSYPPQNLREIEDDRPAAGVSDFPSRHALPAHDQLRRGFSRLRRIIADDGTDRLKHGCELGIVCESFVPASTQMDGRIRSTRRRGRDGAFSRKRQSLIIDCKPAAYSK